MGKRIHNFNPGPAALPLPVLEEIREEFLDFKGSGMSVTEVSHRSKQFDDVINEAIDFWAWVTISMSSLFREGPVCNSV